MTIKIRTALLFAFVFFARFAASGADLYIMYDPACMDRLEYGYGFTPEAMNYVKYHIKISQTEVLVLEVGPESQSPRQNYLAATTVSCGNESLNRRLVDNIRTGSTNVFMVRSTGGQYQMTKATTASYFRRDNRGVLYDSWQFSFDHLGGLSEGENLTNNDPNGINVTYQGVTKYQCADAYLFRQTFTFQPNMYRELYFIPNVGIVEERSSSGDPKDTYSLRRVNDIPFGTYLQRVCASSSGLASDFLRKQEPLNTQANVVPQSNPNANTTQNWPPPVTDSYQERGASVNNPAYHVVERGETLFAISRKYQVTVPQLQQWNSLGNSSALRAGQRLQVSASQGGVTVTPGQGSIQQNTAVNTPPQQPSSTMTSKGGDPRFAWNNTNGVHVVQSGETVAMIALKYGYTEARLRDMNGMASTDIAKVGQRLKTTDCPAYQDPATKTTATPQTNSTGTALPPYGNNTPAYNNNYQNNSQGTSLNDQWAPRGTALNQPGTVTNTRDQGVGYLPGEPASPNFEPYDMNEQRNYNNLSNLGGTVLNNQSNSFPRNDNGNYNNTDYVGGGGAGSRGLSAVPASTPSYSPAAGGFGTPLSSGASNYPTTGNTITTVPQNGGLPDRNYDFQINANGSGNAARNVSTSGQSASGKRTTHTVKEGESLQTIANKYGTTEQNLRQLNKLGARDVVFPYMTIYIN